MKTKTVLSILMLFSIAQFAQAQTAKKIIGSWSLTNMTSFDSANPDGVSINGEEKLKKYSRHIQLEFKSDGKMVSTGPYAGGYTDWKVLTEEEIEVSKYNGTNKQTAKILILNASTLKLEWLSPMMKNKEVLSFRLEKE